MAGESLASFQLKPQEFEPGRAHHVGVKEAVFPFARFGDKVDTVLGPEMKSTGEVMGIDRDYNVAFAKSQLGGGARLPKSGTVFVSVKDADKPRILEATRLLTGLGFRVMATRSRSTKSPKADRISSTPSKTARFRSSLTPPKGRPRWPIAARYAALPSCIKCRTTPLFQGPSPQRRASEPISEATSRFVRCKLISRSNLIERRSGHSDGTCRAISTSRGRTMLRSAMGFFDSALGGLD
jgi:hypothetical protein